MPDPLSPAEPGPPRVLALDTALGACSAAVAIAGELRASRSWRGDTGHAERLLPMIAAVLDEAGIKARDLTRLGVTVGPGSFTGTRIGLAAARALGQVLAIPVIGMTTGAALRAALPDDLPGALPLVTAFEARLGQLYVEGFGPAGEAAVGPHVLMPDAIAALLPGHWRGLRVAGAGVAPAAAALRAAGFAIEPVEGMTWPDAAAFVGAVAAAPDPQGLPRPLYLRPPDAVPTRLPLALKPATRAMAGLLAGLHDRAFMEGWTEAALATLIDQPGTRALLAVVGTAPAGFVLWRAAADEAEILTLCVDEPYRRAGIARALLRAVTTPLREAGAHRLFLEVAEGNAAARALYAAQGFHEVGRRPGYYTEPDGASEDALILRLDLPA